MSRPKKKLAAHKIYRSYLFRSKDPVIDELRTIVQDTYGRIDHKSLKTVELDGGPTVSAMDNWFFGATKRPQNASIEAAGRAMGMKRVWVKHKPK